MGTAYQRLNVTVPSLVLGANDEFCMTRGFNAVNLESELVQIPIAIDRDRLFTVTIALLHRVDGSAATSGLSARLRDEVPGLTQKDRIEREPERLR